jgi:hypothetical protein
MRARFSHECLDYLHGRRVYDLYDTGIAYGHVELVSRYIQPDGVRNSGERSHSEHTRWGARECDLYRLPSITGYIGAPRRSIEIQPVRPSTGDGPLIQRFPRSRRQYRYAGWLTDVDQEALTFAIEDTPSWAAWQGHDCFRLTIECDEPSGIGLYISHEHLLSGGIPRQAIGPWVDGNTLPHSPLGSVYDEHLSRTTRRGKHNVFLLSHQDTTAFSTPGNRGDMTQARAIEHLDSIRLRVRYEDMPRREMHIAMVKFAWFIR